MRSASLALGVFVLAAAALWGFARFAVWEPTGITRGSLVYALKVPKVAKEWPLWQLSGDPLYDVRHGDGPAPSYTRIHYDAKGSLVSFESLVQADGYACHRVGASGLSCERSKGDVLEAHVLAEREALDGLTRVTIEIPAY